MNTTSKKRQFNYLLVIISGLLLAVIITTTVVVLKKPLNQTGDKSEPLPVDSDTSQQPNEEDSMILSSSVAALTSEATRTLESITSTFESATAKETGSNPENSECTNPRVRRSWTELNDGEKTRFLNAVNQMKRNPSKTGSSPNRYEDFTVIHDTYRSVAHSVSAFLPWHRILVNEFDKELQSIDPSVILPYWDWASDSANPADSAVFSNDAFGGDGDPSTGCVTNGAFSNWQVSYPRPHCLQRRFNGRNSAIQRWYSPEQTAAIVFRYKDYTQFRSAFESTPHAAVHNSIGGDMRQNYSPNDPLFWLHHANVDRYFHAWQMENPRSPYNGGSINAVLQPFGVSVSTAYSLPTDSRLCYTYSVGSNSIRNSVRKRSTSPGDLQCPAHIPETYTLRMGGSVERVRMTEEFVCDFTRRLNQKRDLSSGLKIEKSIPENKNTNNTIWRFSCGKERKMILEALE